MRTLFLLCVLINGIIGFGSTFYQIEKIGSINMGDITPYKSAIHENVLYILDSQTIHTYDVSNPEALRKIQVLNIPFTITETNEDAFYAFHFFGNRFLIYYYDYTGRKNIYYIFNIANKEEIYVERVHEMDAQYYDMEGISGIGFKDSYFYCNILDYVNGGYNGFFSVDFSNLNNIKELPRYNVNVYWSVNQILDHYIISTGEGALKVFDISNPNTMTKVAELNGVGPCFGDFCFGGNVRLAYNTLYSWSYESHSVEIVDLKNPEDPTLRVSDISESRIHLVLGENLFLQKESDNSYILTTTIESKLEKVGELKSDRILNEANGIIYGIEDNDICAYSVTPETTFDLKKIQEWGRGPCDNVHAQNETAFITYLYREEEKPILDIVDISNPLDITLITTLQFDYKIDQLFITDNYLYVPQKITLEVYDISDPSNILHRSSIKILGSNIYARLEKFFQSGDTLFLTNTRNDIIFRFDITDKGLPVLMDSFQIESNKSEIVYKDGYFYTLYEEKSDSYDTTRLFDTILVITRFTENGPEEISRIEVITEDDPDEILSGEHFLYVFSENTINVIDITNPENIQLLSSMDRDDNFQTIWATFDGYLLKSSSETLKIYDPGNTGELMLNSEMNYLSTIHPTQKISKNGSTLYVAKDNDGIFAIDFTNPEDPATLFKYDNVGPLNHISVSGDEVIVSNGDIHILNNRNNRLTESLTIDTDKELIKALRIDDIVFAADEKTGLYQFDISDPENIVEKLLQPSTAQHSFHGMIQYENYLIYTVKSSLYIYEVVNNVSNLIIYRPNELFIHELTIHNNNLYFIQNGALKRFDLSSLPSLPDPQIWESEEIRQDHQLSIVSDTLLIVKNHNPDVYPEDIDSYGIIDISDGNGLSGEFVPNTFFPPVDKTASFGTTLVTYRQGTMDFYDMSNPVKPMFIKQGRGTYGQEGDLLATSSSIYALSGEAGILTQYQISEPIDQISDLTMTPLDRETFTAPVTVLLEAVIETNEEWESVLFHWDINNDGTVDQMTNTPSLEYLFTSAGEYYVNVWMTYDGGNSLPYMELFTIEPDTPPTIPSNFRGFFSEDSDINLFWSPSNDNEGINYYAIYKAEDNSLVGTTSDTRYIISGVSHSQLYTFKIKAFDNYGNASGFSPDAMVMPEGHDMENPTAPEMLVGVGLTPSTIRLSWETSFDDVGVRYYAIYDGEDHSLVATTPYNSYVINDLDQYVTYTYTVKAFDFTGKSSGFSNVVQVRTWQEDLMEPTSPKNVQAMGSSDSDILIRWDHSTDNIGVRFYAIYRYEDSALLGTSYTNSITLGGFTPGVNYSFRIKAFDFNNNRSNFSQKVTAQTLYTESNSPTAPGNLTGELVSPTSVRLSWNSSTDDQGVRMYAIYMDSVNTLVGTTMETTFLVEGLTPNTPYTFKAKAFDFNNNRSQFSNEVSLTTSHNLPELFISKTSIYPNCFVGENASSNSFAIRNIGVDILNYQITVEASWLNCSPNNGLCTDETDTIVVTFSSDTLDNGSYHTTITVSDPNAVNSPQTIDVTLTVQEIGALPDLVLIPDGSFVMGDQEYTDTPVHTVDINAFYISPFEVTIEQYVDFLNSVPVVEDSWVYFTDQGMPVDVSHIIVDSNTYSVEEGYELYPMAYVSWYGAKAYCDWLTETQYGTYYLPSEAEWEYACRAGSTTTYYWGDDWDDDYGWCSIGGSGKHPVGQKIPNEWGLYDMSGNVAEWCSDWYFTNAYNNSGGYTDNPSGNPEYTIENYSKVHRGGSTIGLIYCESAFRRYDNPNDYTFGSIGFRVARTVSED